MANRTVVPLIFGAGIDRATGLLTREGRAGSDFRNVYLYRDKAQVRHGHAHINTLVDENGTELTDGLLVQALEAEQVGVVAGLGSDGRVHLFRVGGDGVGLSRIGVAFTLASGARTPPRLLACEQYRKLFVAHDEANRTLRANTVYYDPFGASILTTLSADLDGDTVAGNINFRGVAPYLSYLVGWGYGTESDPDRPEVVRVSHPDDPTQLDPDDYWLAGKGGTPVLRCLQAGQGQTSSVCLVFKPTEIHRIFGYDKRTFGIEPVETGYGIPASRLVYSLNGVIYFWDTVNGPRRTSGGPSEDLSWPLDLEAPEPADLVAAGAVEDGFICYVPGRRCLLFVFGERVYQLSLWDPAALKWNYNENGFSAQSAGILYSGGDQATTAPTGAASGVTLSAPADTGEHVAWTNGTLTGGEVAEVWLHAKTADTWTLVYQVAASGGSQSTDLTGLVPGTDYEAQVRYRRGPYYRADYDSNDPASWPAGSLSNTMATTIAAPVLVSGVWSRVSASVEQVALTWTGSSAVASKVYRGGALVATVDAGTLTYNDQTVPGETSNDYTVRQVGDHESTDSNTVTTWSGPYPGPTIDGAAVICNGQYSVGWTTSNPDNVLVDLRDEAQGATYYEDIRTTSTPVTNRSIAAVDGGPVPNPVNLGETIDVRVRHVETAFGVDDFSPSDQDSELFNLDPC